MIAAFFDIDGTIYRNALLIEHFKKLIKYELFDDIQYRLKVEEAYNLWDTRKGDYDDYLLDLTQLYVVAIKGLPVKYNDFISDQVLLLKGNRVYTYTREMIEWHKKMGHKVFFISGSPAFLVSRMAKKMGVDDDRIKAISAKLEYYVNPFDIVSMLNRENTIYNLEKPGEKPTRKELGTAHIVVPLHYTRFDFMSDSAHDFGVFQADGKGGFLVASEDFHPELLRAGEKLARLEAKVLDLLRMQGLTDDEAIKFMNAVVDVSSFGTANFARAGISTSAFYEFKRDYQAIIDEARRESIKWDKKMIPSYQKQLGNGNLTGEERILVRARLLQTAAQLAIFEIEDKVKHVKTLLSDAKESVQKIINDARTEAFGLATYLSDSEVESLLIDFDIKHYWDDSVETNTNTSAKGFLTEIEQLGTTLVRASGDFAAVDTQQAEDFNNLLADVKGSWRVIENAYTK